MQTKSVLSGKEINLTSDDIEVASNSLNIDKNGNMEFTGEEGNSNIKMFLQGNKNRYMSLNPVSVIFQNIAKGHELFLTNNLNGAWIQLNSGNRKITLVNDGENFTRLSLTDETNTTTIEHTGIVTPELKIANQGSVMCGKTEGHGYSVYWTGTQLQFWVDEKNVGTLSDKRLKTEIQDIDENFIKAIEEVEMKQFKVANRNGLISFGILAQDLIEIFKKYNKNPFDYEIIQETQYKTDDKTIYYTINYEQFLILKQKATDKKLKQLQEKDKQKDKIIQDLIKRIEALEKGVSK